MEMRSLDEILELVFAPLSPNGAGWLNLAFMLGIGVVILGLKHHWSGIVQDAARLKTVGSPSSAGADRLGVIGRTFIAIGVAIALSGFIIGGLRN